MTIQLLEGDCIKIIPTLTQKFKMVFADPPFGIKWTRTSKNYYLPTRNVNVVGGYCEVKEEDYAKFSEDWISDCYDVMEDNSSIYIATGWNNQRHILNALHKVGLQMCNEIVWHYKFGVYQKSNFIDSHYNIFYAIKGNPDFDIKARFSDTTESYHDRENVWQINRTRRKPGEPKTAPQLPEELVRKCLEYSTSPNDWILDPFAGTGTTAAVCKRLNRNCITIEKNSLYIPFIKTRLGI